MAKLPQKFGNVTDIHMARSAIYCSSVICLAYTQHLNDSTLMQGIKWNITTQNKWIAQSLRTSQSYR